VQVRLHGLRHERALLSEHREVLYHRHQGPLLRSQPARHMLRQHGVRTKDDLLPRRLLCAGTDLRE
jgi:hypothetical protein